MRMALARVRRQSVGGYMTVARVPFSITDLIAGAHAHTEGAVLSSRYDRRGAARISASSTAVLSASQPTRPRKIEGEVAADHGTITQEVSEGTGRRREVRSSLGSVPFSSSPLSLLACKRLQTLKLTGFKAGAHFLLIFLRVSSRQSRGCQYLPLGTRATLCERRLFHIQADTTDPAPNPRASYERRIA